MRGQDVNKEEFQIKVNEKYPDESLTVLSYGGARGDKGDTKIKCETCGKVYTYKTGGNVLRKSKKILCRECVMKIVKKKRFEQSLRDIYKNDDLEVVSFVSREKPCVIRCNKCGTEVSFQKGQNALKRNKYFCHTCYPLKYDILQARLRIFKEFIEGDSRWNLITDLNTVTSAQDEIACECTVCGNITTKTMYDYERGRGCLYCSGTNIKSTKDFEKELDDGYTLLSEYKNANQKVVLKHDCGFIYKVTPHNYLSGKRCPQCARKHSKGEVAIKRFLDNNDIPYQQEYPIAVDEHNLRFDFYLPLQDVFIEYQGEQHYHPIEFFGGRERFIKQKEYDDIKRKFSNLVEIPYYDFDRIEDILTNIIN